MANAKEKAKAKAASKLGPLASGTGTGPDGQVQISDIHNKLQHLNGEKDKQVQNAIPYAVVGGAAAAVALVAIVFILGRARGKRKDTWVEVRRL